MSAGIVLYVADLALSTGFYRAVLGVDPRWNEDGSAVFDLPGGAHLGLHAEASVMAREEDGLPDPRFANGIPRGEVQVEVVDAPAFAARALELGARPLEPRAPGEVAVLDPDGHVLVFLEADEAAIETWHDRAHRSIGPIAAGLILDFFDLLTPGSVGLYAGPLIGFLAGWYLAGIERFRGGARFALALLAAVYLMVPVTTLLPLATLIGALARFREPREQPLGS